MSANILVVGATGIIGTSFLQHCLGPASSAQTTLSGREAACHSDSVGDNPAHGYKAPANWQYTGLTRNPLKQSQYENLQYVNADLLGGHKALQQLRDITHIVFAGYAPEVDPQQQLDRNAALLQNTMDAVVECPLEHIVLLQGMKYYGSHKGAFKTPAKESDPRIDEPHYYYAQEDIVKASGIDWTCLRPHVVCGTASMGTPQNILAVLGCYASLCKAKGQALNWPGSEASYRVLNQATDARLLAQSIVWALQSPHARNEAFNITNGDFFRWNSLWPKIAELFDAPCGSCKPHQLQAIMNGESGLWDNLIQQYQLQKYPLNKLCDWSFADYILKTEWDVMASSIKIRQAGFDACVDTEAMYLELLGKLRDLKFLP